MLETSSDRHSHRGAHQVVDMGTIAPRRYHITLCNGYTDQSRALHVTWWTMLPQLDGTTSRASDEPYRSAP